MSTSLRALQERNKQLQETYDRQQKDSYVTLRSLVKQQERVLVLEKMVLGLVGLLIEKKEASDE